MNCIVTQAHRARSRGHDTASSVPREGHSSRELEEPMKEEEDSTKLKV